MKTSGILIRELLYGQRVDKSLKNPTYMCIWSLENPKKGPQIPGFVL